MLNYPNFEEVKCDHCHQSDYETLSIIENDFEMFGRVAEQYAMRNFRMVRCKRCTLVYLNPRPSAQEIYHYYPDTYPCFEEFPPKNRLMALLHSMMVIQKRKLLFPHLPANGVLLDYGCGNGHWLIGLKKYASRHQRLIGIDPCKKPITDLKSKGIEAYVGDESILPTLFKPETIDVIIISHLIEHVPNPLKLFQELESYLTPNGIIYGVTPNEAAWDRGIFGKLWSGWHAPRHFILFNRNTLGSYAQASNLELQHWKSEMEAASHWAVSFHTWLLELGLKPKGENRRLKCYPLFLLFFMGITLIQKWVSQTSIVSFILTKRAMPTPAQT